MTEVVGEGGDREGRERRKRKRWRRHRVSWRKRWQGGREREYRGEEKEEEAVGPGGGLPSYRRDPAKILRDLSLLLQVGLAYFSSAFDQVLPSRAIERREMANRSDDHRVLGRS